MFLKPAWVGKIHGVGVYATHSVRMVVQEQIFFISTQKVTKKVAPCKINHKNAKKILSNGPI